ncbi:MAG TPA: imidazole glycerol phosphate synthase subunit HisH [Firmicutes bacterium]|nr:imidazole glycerol phosphate synthase subunit HisH [Bacillota bacterium]
MIGILDYGMGNLRSVQKAVEYLGGGALISSEARVLDGCERLILPGVGSFAAGMRNLEESGLSSYVLRRVADTPVLGICLGMQFLLAQSEEEGVHKGLGLIEGRAVRFTQGKIPHMGWNAVEGMRSPLFAGIAEGTQFYFVHSYYADVAEADTIGRTEYYRTFASAIARGNAYGVQFHPEKSGAAGLQVLRNFMRL